MEDVEERYAKGEHNVRHGIAASHTERLLLGGEEDRVYEFDILEVVVDHVVEFKSL